MMSRGNSIWKKRWRRLFRGAWLMVVLLFAVPGVGGANAKDITGFSLEDLMAMEVTTLSRTAKPISSMTAAAFVVTQEDIRRSGATSIPQALRMVPGLQVARIDANKWAVTARGFNGWYSNKLLVLLDGRSVYATLFSGVYWDALDTHLADVERIEVIRGPGASLWGANAVNGIINVVTKSAAQTTGGMATGIVGTEETWNGALRYGFRIGDRAYARMYAKGFDKDSSLARSSGESAYDDWSKDQAGFRLDWERDRQNDFTLQGDIYQGRAHDHFFINNNSEPPFVVPERYRSEFSGGNVLGRWQHCFSEASDMILQTYLDITRRDSEALGEERDLFDMDFQHRWLLSSGHELLWGAGYRYANGKAIDGAVLQFRTEERSDHLFSCFLQDEICLVPQRLTVLIGSKFEHNDYTGFEYQPNARLLWTPHRDNSFWASVSRAVRTPSQVETSLVLRETVSNDPFPVALEIRGSDSVDAEDVIAWEAGYRYHPPGGVSLDLALFYNRYDNISGGVEGTPEMSGDPPVLILPVLIRNTISGESYGLEIVGDWSPRDWWRITGTYTLLKLSLKTEMGDDDMSVSILKDTNPEHQVSVRSRMDLPRDTAFDVQARYVSGVSFGDIPAYVAVDARFGWKINERFELSLLGENLFDPAHAEFVNPLEEVVPTEVERAVYAKLTCRF